MEDCIPLRSPFRPLQQHHQNVNSSRDRLKDSPMDFSYDSPQRENVHHTSSGSSWLMSGSDDEKKRPREAIDRTEVFSFGSTNSTNGSTGAFLFHQPLAPTIAGPDVEMSSDTTPVKAVPTTASFVASSSNEQARDDHSSRPLSSSGALTRISRNRGTGGKRGALHSEHKKPPSGSQGKGRRKEKSIREEDWQDDEEEDEVEEKKTLLRRVGDTTNIQYVFGGPSSTSQSDKRRHSSLLDPEWCLGMAQFGFNVMLLLGVLWLIFGVVQTLQRDVADKVREYELEFLSEIEACSHSYYLNKCGTDGAVPALASACASWQKCSAKDPAIVGRARVAAETVAEIVNGFVDVVSWKSMLFTLLSLVIVVGATNSTLSFFRLRSRKAQTYSNGHNQSMPPYDQHPAHLGYGYHHPYNPAGHWQASPPATPSTKRMCR